MKSTLIRVLCVALLLTPLTVQAAGKKKKTKKKPQATLKVGEKAPDLKIKDQKGKLISLSKLLKDGPVLVRLTCGCAGCDKELAYFQAMHRAYKGKGLTSLAIFREPDSKVAKYAKTKKLNMLYAVDPKGNSWKIFGTKTMPSNFLIGQDGRVRGIALGCDPSGLIAQSLSKKIAKELKTEKIDVQKKVKQKK